MYTCIIHASYVYICIYISLVLLTALCIPVLVPKTPVGDQDPTDLIPSVSKNEIDVSLIPGEVADGNNGVHFKLSTT